MVVINLTFFIELALFLLFLWAVQVLVFRPLLRTMDAREDQIEGDQTEAKTTRKAAKTKEEEYEGELSAARRKGINHVAEVRREAVQQRATRIQEARQKLEAEVAEARQVAQSKLEAQRGQFDDLSATLANEIAEKLAR